jgi:molecular chaperone GrpE
MVGDEAQELLELLQRERADFANFRKRATQERIVADERAKAQLIALLLPLLDDVQRAANQVPPDLVQHPWARGVALSTLNLRDFLAKAGVEQIGIEGEAFDPRLHEAVHFEERSDVDDPIVVDVVRPGYRMGDRILRPATVVVAGAPSDGALPNAPAPSKELAD